MSLSEQFMGEAAPNGVHSREDDRQKTYPSPTREELLEVKVANILNKMDDCSTYESHEEMYMAHAKAALAAVAECGEVKALVDAANRACDQMVKAGDGMSNAMIALVEALTPFTEVSNG